MEEEINIPENVDIQKALKEFEEKSHAEELEKVPEEVSKASETSQIVQFVIKYSGGRINEERQAEYIIFGFLVLVIIVPLFLFFSWGGTAGSPEDIKILPAAF